MLDAMESAAERVRTFSADVRASRVILYTSMQQECNGTGHIVGEIVREKDKFVRRRCIRLTFKSRSGAGHDRPPDIDGPWKIVEDGTYHWLEARKYKYLGNRVQKTPLLGHVPGYFACLPRFLSDVGHLRGKYRLTGLREEHIEGRKFHVIEAEYPSAWRERGVGRWRFNEPLYTKVEVYVLADDLLVRKVVETKPRNMGHVTYEFTNVKVNIDVDRSLFVYKLPPGCVIKGAGREQ